MAKFISKIRSSFTVKNTVLTEDEEGNKKNVVVDITFNKANRAGLKCYYSTNNPIEIEAIKTCKEFLNGFITVIEDEKDKELNKSNKADKEGVDNNSTKDEVEYINLEADKKQLAIEELISRVPEIGEIDKRITIAELKALANVNGYDFPNMTSR